MAVNGKKHKPPEPAQLAEAIEMLKQAVGPFGWSTHPGLIEPHAVDWTGSIRGDSPLLLKPANTEEVAKIVTICRQYGLKIVPQGGNTSLAGGSVPSGEGVEIIVNLARMNKVRGIDTINDTITVDAGCLLAAIQAEAANASRFFPLRLASEGSCQIGGNLATNAGGSNVIRYGNARDLVLGLEVVLADGRIWSGLRGLRKDNMGYDLKQLFIGSEGTLGIITGAVLKLFPRPASVATAVCAVPSVQAALELLVLCKQRTGGQITAFELMPRNGLELVFKHFPACRMPLDRLHDWQLLIEFSSIDEAVSQQERIEAVLSEAYASGLIVDAAIASSIEQGRSFWAIREALAEADMKEGATIQGDISVPISAIPDFLNSCSDAIARAVDGARIIAFGHLGDGNIHFGIIAPEAGPIEDFLARSNEIEEIICDHADRFGGSVAAEHGLGIMKTDAVLKYRGDVEHDLMLAIKHSLDPQGMMNPGKVLKRK
jgi:FAD/FMN-containing dehydrogenase